MRAKARILRMPLLFAEVGKAGDIIDVRGPDRCTGEACYQPVNASFSCSMWSGKLSQKSLREKRPGDYPIIRLIAGTLENEE